MDQKVLSSFQIKVFPDEVTQVENVLGHGNPRLARDFADLFLELYDLDKSYRAEYVQFFSTNPQFHHSLARLVTLQEAKLHGRLQMAGEISGTATGAVFGFAASAILHYAVNGKKVPFKLGAASTAGGAIGGYFAGRRAGLQAVSMEQAIYGGMKGGAVVGTGVGLALTGGTLIYQQLGPKLLEAVKDIRASPDTMEKLKVIAKETNPPEGSDTPPPPPSPSPGPIDPPTTTSTGNETKPTLVPKVEIGLHKAVEKAIRPILGEYSPMVTFLLVMAGQQFITGRLSNTTSCF